MQEARHCSICSNYQMKWAGQLQQRPSYVSGVLQLLFCLSQPLKLLPPFLSCSCLSPCPKCRSRPVAVAAAAAYTPQLFSPRCSAKKEEEKILAFQILNSISRRFARWFVWLGQATASTSNRFDLEVEVKLRTSFIAAKYSEV